MSKLVLRVLLAMLLLPATVAAAPLAQTLPETAIPQSVIGNDWKVENVRGPNGPYGVYQVQLQQPGKDLFTFIQVGEVHDAAEAQAIVENEKANLQKNGWKMLPVPGPGDGAAYRGISKTKSTAVDPELAISSEVQVTVVRYIGRVDARFTEVITGGVDTPEQTLYQLNARLFSLQVDRFHTLAPVPQPTPIATPAPTPVPQPLDARALVLLPDDLGANWSVTETTGDAQAFTTEYFNNTVDYTGFIADRLTIEPLTDVTAADARIAWWRSNFEDRQFTVRDQSGLGDARAIRTSYSLDAGLTALSLVYRIGSVVVVASAEAATSRGEANIEAEASRVAQLETARLRQISGSSVPPPPMGTLTLSSALDPASLVLPLDLLGEGWSTVRSENRGSAEQSPRVYTAIYGNDTTYSARRTVGITIIVTPDNARARLAAGINTASSITAGIKFEPVSGLGDDVAYSGMVTAADGRTTAQYLYTTGPMMVRVEVAGSDTSTDELSQQAWELAVAQQQRVLDGTAPALESGPVT
jgi:hypothetical protein